MGDPERIPAPGEPTDAPAGSAWKLEVLAARAARKEALFHPQDNPRKEGAPSPRAGFGPAARRLPSGVYYDAARGKYRARVSLPGRGKVSLGMYETARAAMDAVSEALLLAEEAGEEG